MPEGTTLPLPSDVFSPAVLKNIDPKSPAGARLFAAKGLLVCQARELLSAIYVLTFDPDPKIAETARGYAAKLPDKQMAGLRDEEIAPTVLDFFADALAGNAAAEQIIVDNMATPDETIARMAERVSEPVSETIARNQLRVLRDERIVRGLVRNPNIRLAIRDDLLDFCVRSGLVLSDVPEFAEARRRIFGADPVAAAEIVEAEANTAEKVVNELGTAVTDEAAVLDDGKRLTFTQRVMKMSVSQKIKLASLGNKEARTMLLRDSNKLVAMAAVTSPRISDSEIVGLANSRTLHNEVMRYVAGNREWTKNYQVKVNLVNNPKCPQDIALRLMQFLHVSELRAVMRNKNIPSAVQTNARRMLAKFEK